MGKQLILFFLLLGKKPQNRLLTRNYLGKVWNVSSRLMQQIGVNVCVRQSSKETKPS